MPKSKHRKNHAEKSAKRAKDRNDKRELYRRTLTKLAQANAERLQLQALAEDGDDREI